MSIPEYSSDEGIYLVGDKTLPLYPFYHIRLQNSIPTISGNQKTSVGSLLYHLASTYASVNHFFFGVFRSIRRHRCTAVSPLVDRQLSYLIPEPIVSSLLKLSMSIQVIDTTESVAKLVDSILNLPVSPPSLYIDLEGISLSPISSASILTLYVLPSATVYIVDIHKLGVPAFSTEGHGKKSFQAILESDNIPKVFFDVRNDSNVLYSHYQVKLAGVQDLQLMELATRTGPMTLLRPLASCIRNDAGFGPREEKAWTSCKSKGKAMFTPEQGGRYEVFNERPLKEAIIYYCAQDVTLLNKLWSTYNSKLTPFWRAKVTEESQVRIAQSQSAEYNPSVIDKTLGPW